MADDTQSLGPSSVGSDPAQDNAPIMQGIGGLAQGAASALPTPQVTQQNTTPPPDQPGTHSKLISMLQHGLIGLGAAGKAIATRGKEGGVEEVANIQAQEQQSQRADEELAMRKKAFSTQNALAELQLENARQNAPIETQKRIQDLKSSQLEYAQKLYPHATLVADDNDPSHGNQVLDYLKSKGLALHDVVVHHVNGVGTLVTPRTDMYGKTMTPDLADSLNKKYGALGVDGTRFKAGMDMESAEDLSKGYDAQVASTLQKAQLQEAQSRATTAGAQAGVAPQMAKLGVQEKQEQIATQETTRKVAEQSLVSGAAKSADGSWNQNSLPVQLVEGNIDPSQLTKRAKDYNTTLSAANAYSQEKYGKPFNAAQANLDFTYSKAPQTQNTLKMIQGMTEPGGAIEIAQNAAKKLPRFDSPTANKVFNATATGFGSAEATNFHTAMLGLADEYSKVMGGGVSSDTGRQQSLDLLKDSYSKGQLQGAIDIMRKDISARSKALVGDNRYLQRQYPQTSGTAQPQQNSGDPFAAFGGKAR